MTVTHWRAVASFALFASVTSWHVSTMRVAVTVLNVANLEPGPFASFRFEDHRFGATVYCQIPVAPRQWHPGIRRR